MKWISHLKYSFVTNVHWKDRNIFILKWLSFDSDLFDSESNDIAIYWFNEELGEWIKLDDIEVDWEDRGVSGTIDHFTKFAVIAAEKRNLLNQSKMRLNSWH